MIGVCPAGMQFKEELLDKARRANKDGFGIMWAKDDKIHVHRTMDMSKIMDIVEAAPIDVPRAVHFRLATHGLVNVKNCHPYKIAKGHFMMHNGVLPFYDREGVLSDTALYAYRVLGPLVRENPGIWDRPAFRNLVELSAGSMNKFVLMRADGDYFIVNQDDGYEVDDGVWISSRPLGYGFSGRTYIAGGNAYGDAYGDWYGDGDGTTYVSRGSRRISGSSYKSTAEGKYGKYIGGKWIPKEHYDNDTKSWVPNPDYAAQVAAEEAREAAEAAEQAAAKGTEPSVDDGDKKLAVDEAEEIVKAADHEPSGEDVMVQYAYTDALEAAARSDEPMCADDCPGEGLTHTGIPFDHELEADIERIIGKINPADLQDLSKLTGEDWKVVDTWLRSRGYLPNEAIRPSVPASTV